jgi:hypothetical protein
MGLSVRFLRVFHSGRLLQQHTQDVYIGIPTLSSGDVETGEKSKKEKIWE